MSEQSIGFAADEIQTGSSTRSARLKWVIVNDDYLAQLAGSSPDEIAYAAVSLVGPRKRVDRIVGGLKLLA